ncbi:DUF7213 family protein [Mycolicibacterium sphagni]|uniref:Uncharacterized protein n=1 Tax=Mycolicibacterium sphagni TaxID=1786 RepID=A0A255DTX2_9MYCO|nr:hypothetical protein [Mycolicibacterium sphagni]OYN80432.1 hypothetical protein CG716_09920 [Mycolicibacterium sphagni]
MSDLEQLRTEAYEALEVAITKMTAMLNAKALEHGEVPDLVAVDAVLLIGTQWIDEDGDRCGGTNIFPRHGWQPGYITAGLLTTAHARVAE